MLSKSALNKIPKVDYYVTSGLNSGRVVACRKPFYRGKGVYHMSMDAEDWEVQGSLPLDAEELEAFKESVRASRVAALKESVRLNGHLGFELVENPKWVFQLRKKSS